MEKYDYREAMKCDIVDFLKWERDYGELGPYDSTDEMYDNLYERMMDCDSITGNESGKYCSSEWEAEECLCHNMDLLKDAFDCYGYSTDYLEKGAQWCDVIVRCYIVGEVLSEVLSDDSYDWYSRYVFDPIYADDEDDSEDDDDLDFYIEDIDALLA